MAFDTNKLEEVGNDAIETLRLYFRSDTSEEKFIPGARIASSVISTIAKIKQTESAREATSVLVARELANNPEDFKKYIQVAMPNSPFKTLIEDKSKKKTK
jgi:hypothetical protein